MRQVNSALASWVAQPILTHRRARFEESMECIVQSDMPRLPPPTMLPLSRPGAGMAFNPQPEDCIAVPPRVQVMNSMLAAWTPSIRGGVLAATDARSHPSMAPMDLMPSHYSINVCHGASTSSRDSAIPGVLAAWPPSTPPPAPSSSSAAPKGGKGGKGGSKSSSNGVGVGAGGPGPAFPAFQPYCPNFLGERVVRLLLANAVDSWDKLRQVRVDRLGGWPLPPSDEQRLAASSCCCGRRGVRGATAAGQCHGPLCYGTSRGRCISHRSEGQPCGMAPACTALCLLASPHCPPQLHMSAPHSPHPTGAHPPLHARSPRPARCSPSPRPCPACTRRSCWCHCWRGRTACCGARGCESLMQVRGAHFLSAAVVCVGAWAAVEPEVVGVWRRCGDVLLCM